MKPEQPVVSALSDDNNEKRLIAHQIIIDLFHAKETGQIQLLLMACSLSAKQLAPQDYAKFVKHSLATMSVPGSADCAPQTRGADDPKPK